MSMSFLTLLPLATWFSYVYKCAHFFFLCHLHGWMDFMTITDLMTQISNFSAHFSYILADKYCISRPMSCTTTSSVEGFVCLTSHKGSWSEYTSVGATEIPLNPNKLHLQCLLCKVNVSTSQLAGKAQVF